MLNFNQIDKLTDQMEAKFKDENEGRHVELNGRNNSGPIRFEFDIHVQEFRLTTDRDDNLSLLIYIVCKNGKFGHSRYEVAPTTEDPVLEYYENLMDDKPGKFTFSNIDELILDHAAFEIYGKQNDIDRWKVDQIFKYFEYIMNEDSVYNINLSKIIFAEEIEARQKEKELKEQEAALAEAEAALAEAKQNKKDARNAAIKNIASKTGNAVKEIGISAAVATGLALAIPCAPVVILGGCIALCLDNIYHSY